MYLWKQFKSKTEKGKVYSTGIEINDKGEVINYTCSCIYGAFYMWTKKNGNGKKPCCHINHLIRIFKNIKEVQNAKEET